MIVAKKFWPIKVANFAPEANPVLTLFGNANSTGTSIVAVKREEFNAIIAVGIDNVRVIDQIHGDALDKTIVSADSDTLTIEFSGKVCDTGQVQIMLVDISRPVAGRDIEIQAMLCLNSSHSEFIFKDENHRQVRIPPATMVKGAIYYFQIREVVNCSEGDFIGYAS
jgi:hypothetical protein